VNGLKKTVVCSNKIQLSIKWNKQVIQATTIDKSQKQDVELKKPDTKETYIHMKL